MKRTIFTCISAALLSAIAIGGAPCFNVNSSAEETPAEVSIETVNEYLREHGYSEEFIEMTGEHSKRELYENNAVFESESVISEDGIAPLSDDSYWNGFTNATLTVSHLSYSNNISEKQLSFSWRWKPGYRVYQDAVSIYWGDAFTALPETAYLQICSNATCIEKHVTNSSVYVPNFLVDASFYTYSGAAAVTDYQPNVGIGCRFEVDDNATMRLNYASGCYGVFKFDLNNYKGTYSVTIKKANSNPDYNGYNSAVANYFRWTSETKYKCSLNISTSGVGINIEPEYKNYYKKSVDYPVAFQYKN